MGRVAVDIPVRVPFDVLRQFVKESAEEQSISQAYYKLRGTTNPSRVIESTREHVAIYEPTFDPTVKAHGFFRTGWTVSYHLTPVCDLETQVEVAVEYNRMTEILGLGLIKPQAENEIIHRLTALLAFEKGYHTQPSANADQTEPRLLAAPGEAGILSVKLPEREKQPDK